MVKRLLAGLDNNLRRLSAACAIAAGWALIGLSVTVGFEVVARKAFRFSIQGVDEIGGYVLAIGATLGFAYALHQKSHIRIDVFVRALPPAWQAFADVLALATLNLFIWLLLYRVVGLVQQSLELQALAVSPLRTPLALPQSIWAGALLLFGIVALVQLARALVGVARADWARVNREFGVAPVEDEVAQEVGAARRRMAGQALEED